MVKRARRSLVGLLVTVALVGTACAGSNGGGGAAELGNDRGAEGSDINPVPRDQLADGGELVWPLAQMPPNFNAHHVDGSLADNSAVLGGLSFGVFLYDAKAQPRVNPNYFESVELTSTDPDQVITYRVNPDAAWYDGTPITFTDFEAMWRAKNGTNPAFHVSSTQGYDKIGSVVQGRDEREIVVTMQEKFADWRMLFSGLLPAATTTDPAVFNDGWRQQPLTSAGPFRFDRIDRTAQTITVVRNENWWGNPAMLDRIVYRVLDPDQHVAAMVNREVDFAEIGPDVDKFRRASATPGVELRTAAGPDFRHITINGRSPILSDVRLRRALAMAIDRDVITRAILTPLGVEAEPLGNHILMGTMAGYQNNAGELTRADPDRAAELLDELGWTREGTGIRRKDGQELAIRFVIPSGVATSRQEAELVWTMLGRIGVRVNVQTVPVGDFFEQYIRPGNFEFTVFSWLGTVFPISSSKSIYQNPTEGDDGELIIRQNYARVGSAELDELFDRATAIFDQDEANRLANQIDGMIWEMVHSITLYQRPQIVGVRNPNLANFGASGFQSTPYEDFGFAQG